MQIADIQSFYSQSRIKWYKHAVERMQERDISREDVKNCIMNGEIIEDYPDDFPHPSCLIFGHNSRALRSMPLSAWIQKI